MEPRHGATYDRVVAMAKATEESGFDAFFRGDHYLGIDSTDPEYRPDRLVDHARRRRARDQPHQARDAHDRRDVPPPGRRGQRGGHRRPDVGRAGRSRNRHRLVRARAQGVRHPVPTDRRAVRPPRRGDADHQRAVDDAPGRAVQLPGPVLAAGGGPQLRRARAEAAAPDRHRRHRSAPHAADGGPVRRRIQQRRRPRLR